MRKIIIDRSSREHPEVSRDPLMRWVHMNWGTCWNTLYLECERLGIDRVKQVVYRLRGDEGIQEKGPYLRETLRHMR